MDGQVVELQNSGADLFMNFAIGKAFAQSIRKAAALNWRPLYVLFEGSGQPNVLTAAGIDRGTGFIAGAALKDPLDPQWHDDAGMKQYLASVYSVWRRKGKPMMGKSFFVAIAALSILPMCLAYAESAPGVSATEIKIGQTMPYSGPISMLGEIGRAGAGYLQMVNDHGGVNGRKIMLVSVDDGYIPAKTVEATRKLVEQDGVAFLFDSLGGHTNNAVRPYLNAKQIPQIFAQYGSILPAEAVRFPWTVNLQVPNDTEGRILARYVLNQKPDAKIAILYQNDVLGRDLLLGVRAVLGDKADRMIVKALGYEITDPWAEKYYPRGEHNPLAVAGYTAAQAD